MQPLRQRKAVVEDADRIFGQIVTQYVGNDVGQVLGGHQLLLVAQLHDPFGHLAHRGFVEVDAQRFEVLHDVGLARSLAEGVFADAAEPFGEQFVEVEVVLVVAVGVDAGALREDAFADDRAVGGNTDAGVGLDHAADVVDLRLVDAGGAVQAVVQDGDRTRQRCVPGPLAQPVYRDVDPVESGFHGRGGIGDGQIVVVVGVEVEAQAGIAPYQIAAEPFGGVGIEHAQRVGAHETLHGGVGQCVEHGVDVLRRMLHAVGPVFQIDVYPHAPRNGLVDRSADVAEMLFGRAAELFAAVLE